MLSYGSSGPASLFGVKEGEAQQWLISLKISGYFTPFTLLVSSLQILSKYAIEERIVQ
jgi:hypothetical protein